MSGCKMRSQCASRALVKKRPRADRAKAVVEICRHFAQPRLILKTQQFLGKKDLLLFFVWNSENGAQSPNISNHF